MLLSVSAKILKVNDMMELICKDQTKARPIRFALLAPMLMTTEMTPKYPAAAIVMMENKSVIRLIHLVAIFWFTMAVM